jgi:hypothetical protein
MGRPTAMDDDVFRADIDCTPPRATRSLVREPKVIPRGNLKVDLAGPDFRDLVVDRRGRRDARRPLLEDLRDETRLRMDLRDLDIVG